MELGQRVDQVGRGHALGHAVAPAARLHQIVKEQRNHVVRLDERAIRIQNAKAVGVTVGGEAQLRAKLLHFCLGVAQQRVGRLRRMTAEEHIAVVVNRFDRDAGLAQNTGGVAASRSPEGIVDHFDARLGDGLQIHQFGQPLQECRLHIGRLEAAFRRWGRRNRRAVDLQRQNCCLNLLGHDRQRRATVGGRILDAVVLRRIVRGGKVDGPGGLHLAHRVGDGRRGRGLGNHNRSNASRGQTARRHVHKALAQKARIAPHQHAMRLRKRLHVGGNPGHRQLDIGHGKLVGYNRPPA